MKRILFSILFGILFPIIYTVLAALIFETLFPQHEHLLSMEVADKPSLGLILAPVAVPFWIYDYIRFYNYFGLRYIFDTVWFRVGWTLVPNFLFYSVLSYCAFRYFGLFKSADGITEREPPPPPQFSGKKYPGEFDM